VKHFTILRAAGYRIDIPALGCRRNEHDPRDRAGLAQRLPCPANRIGVAGRLHTEQRIGIELFVGRGVLDLHLSEIDLELLGYQHRDGRVGALAHLHVRHDEDNSPIAADADERIGHERGLRCEIQPWQIDAQ
jgi:hypothetical protein